MNAMLAAIIGLFHGQADPKTIEFMRQQAGNNLGHKATAAHKMGSGGTGYTKARHEENKAQRKMSARSRRINQGGSKRK